MRWASALLLFLGLAALLVAAAAAPPAERPLRVNASAPSATLAVVSDRAVAGRGDNLNLTVWLNVTGNGQFQRTWVNLTLNTSAVPSLNSLVQVPPWTQPAGCVYGPATNWYIVWECDGLKAGTYEWSIPATVPENATVGHVQRVDVDTFSLFSTGSTSGSANTTVWIAGAVLRIVDVDSLPTDSVRAGQIVQFWVNATNDASPGPRDANGTGTAFNLTLTIELDPGLQPGEDAANLTSTLAALPPQGILSVNLEAIVARNLTAGTSVGIRVFLSYQDFNRHAIGPIEGQSSPLYVVRANLLSTASLVAGAAIGLGAILTTLVVLLYVGQRRIVIDEVFLMTKGGILIRHVSRNAEVRKDDDLVASMFVAIQEFLRDSFRREASLDSVAFGTRRAAVVRGELTVLAAVTSRGDADAVTPELLAAVRSIEARNWDALRTWDGNLSRLEDVDEALARLMKGGFRAAWRVQLT